MIPEPYALILLALIAYRLWRLLAEDDILEIPRRKLVRLATDWEEGDSVPREYREKLALFIICPWCAGFWVCGAVYAAWMATLGEWPDSVEDGFVGLGVWFALSALVGFQRMKLDPPD